VANGLIEQVVDRRPPVRKRIGGACRLIVVANSTPTLALWLTALS
jgi:hypothetical protein